MLATVALVGSTAAQAEDFHGFDPQSFAGTPLTAEQLKAMVADAVKATPPKNGSKYVIGFANLERDISFGKLVENGIKAAADAAGVDLVIVDNKLDGPTAIANAHTLVTDKVDFAIEFQTDVSAAPDVMAVFNAAATKVVAIDIPMPGATFFGVNNPKLGYMGGSFLAQASIAKFGDKVKSGYLVIGGLPQSGVVPSIRTAGQKAGFLDSVDGFPVAQILVFDTKNTNEESYKQMQSLLGHIPAGAPIMATAINDQAALGILRAIKEAKREGDAIVVGNGADEAAALASEPTLIGATGSFPERYGNFLLPIVLTSLAGHTLPPAVFMTHTMVTKSNLCKFSATLPCVGAPPVAYEFPQAKFEAYLKTLGGKRELKGYEALIPKA